jgi:hypothetical protein
MARREAFENLNIRIDRETSAVAQLRILMRRSGLDLFLSNPSFLFLHCIQFFAQTDTESFAQIESSLHVVRASLAVPVKGPKP